MVRNILGYEVLGPLSHDNRWVIVELEMKGSVLHRSILIDDFATEEEATIRADELRIAIQQEQ